MKGGLGKRIRIAVLAFAARLLYGLVQRTIRPVIGPDIRECFEALARNERLVFAFWHDQLAMVQRSYQGRGAGICIQVSRHSDGEIIARALRHFGVRTARGSATRGGMASLREMLFAHREGYDLAIAPDGPRGPRHQARPGVIRLAQVTRSRLFPIACVPRRAWVFRKSWDHFLLPAPFTRVYYVAGEALSVPDDADDAAIEDARAKLEAELLRATSEAERRARESYTPE